MLEVTVNGVARTVAEGTTVEELLRGLDLSAARVAVERNGEIVPRPEHGRCVLARGDVLEVVTLVGGG